MEDMYFILKRAQIQFLVFTDETGLYLFIKWCINCAFQREKAPEARDLLKHLQNSSIISKCHIKWIKEEAKRRNSFKTISSHNEGLCSLSLFNPITEQIRFFFSEFTQYFETEILQTGTNPAHVQNRCNLKTIRFSALCESIRRVLEKRV